jgi:hypothetical protein
MIAGTARGLATDKKITEAEAVRKLRALAAGRAALLAEAAGVSFFGFSGDDPTKQATRRAGELRVAAGADRDQLEHWVAVRPERSMRRPSTYNRRRHRP